jgi:Fe-S-cluster-containing dehydrogenase component
LGTPKESPQLIAFEGGRPVAKDKAKVRPPAALVPRPEDEELTIDQLQKISLFAGLKEQPGVEEFPGTLVLRHYHEGDVICRLGEPGWTAFYILTRQDLLTLREGQLQDARRDVEQLRQGQTSGGELSTVLARLEERARKLESEIANFKLTESRSDERVAVVSRPSPSQARRWEWFKSIFQQPGSGQAEAQHQAFLTEGELLGEMSCLYRTPRSATVVVQRDCFMLEMLRNILDKMLTNRNKAFKDQIDALYRKRFLELHLRALPLFRDLSAEQIDGLRNKAGLQAFEPGELVCDERERSDGMYIVRSGFVQVMKNVSFLFSPDEIQDWPALCAALHTGGQEAAGARRKIWDALPEPVRTLLSRVAASGNLADAEKQVVAHALNDLLKQPKLAAAAEFNDILQSAKLADEVRKLPSSLKKWANHQQVCGFNRRFLSTIYPGVFPLPPRSPDEVRVLNYRSEGDYIGEMGVLTGQPRSATCIAYDHPESKFGRVEMVRISKELFDEIMAASPVLKHAVNQVVEETRRQTALSMEKPLWDELNASIRSERFAELGLIQGQKLMLIDLDRCTRCDECVKACVATHPDDGRSRLFLDGHVFKTMLDGEPKNYLVPATCRQCKDPVCLIGCPVGSIHKGENGQIVIEDWCIGCSRCAEQCPYNAIQMHAIGILPKKSRGWRYRAAAGQTENAGWYDPSFDDRNWNEGQSPFYYDRQLRDRLSRPAEMHFRHSFALDSKALTSGNSFQLQVLSLARSVAVWINGSEVIRKTSDQAAPMKPKDKGESWNLETYLAAGHTGPSSRAAPLEGQVKGVLRPGRNVVAARVTATPNSTDVLFELGLFQLSTPVVPEGMSGEFTQDLVMNRAVVCDMCSAQFGKRPACVNACPHEAAMRVNARELFREGALGSSR